MVLCFIGVSGSMNLNVVVFTGLLVFNCVKDHGILPANYAQVFDN